MKKIFVICCAMITLMQCQKENVSVKEQDVYVGGTLSSNGHLSPAYWKNGAATELSTATGDSTDMYGNKTVGPYVNVVRIVDGSIYAGGAQVINNISYARIWKDGVATSLNDGTYNSSVNSFVISGNEIHVVGDEMVNGIVHAKYWKNGMASTLSDNGEAVCIFLSGSDVYAAGYEFLPDYKSVGVYWKNGVRTVLTDTTWQSVILDGITVGGDIYFTGTEQKSNGKRIAKYWKNGVAIALTDGAHDAYVNGIATLHGDVYIAGFEQNSSNVYIAKYWKNGTPVILSDGTSNKFAWSIAVNNSGDVYVAGYGDGQGLFWKNGSEVSFNSESSKAYFSKITIGN